MTTRAEKWAASYVRTSGERWQSAGGHSSGKYMPPNGIGARSSPFTSYKQVCHSSLHVKFRNNLHTIWGTQLVEALRYKPEGHGFDSRWCHCNFSLTYSFQSYYGPRVDSASNINEYQEYFLGGKDSRCAELTNLTTFMCRMS